MARILYVTDGVAPYVIGGMQSVARRHICWLSESKHEVLTLYSNTPADVVPNWPGQTLCLAWPRRPWIGRLDPWRYVRDLKRYSGVVVEAARAFAPELVYSEGPLLHAYLGLLNCAPVIFHPHGLEMFQHKGSLTEDMKSLPLRGIMRNHAQRAEIVLCQGGELCRLLEERAGAPHDRIRLLPNSHERRSPPRAASASAPRNRLLFVARNEKRKGLGVLLRAMAQLPEARLTVVGVDGSPKYGGNVSFLGLVRDRARLDALFGEADFLVVPSLAEGMPTVLWKLCRRACRL